MTEFKKGDVCALEVVIDSDGLSGAIVFAYCQPSGATKVAVRPEDLTLFRRAPVDLATCDLSGPVAVVGVDGRGQLIGRYGKLAWVYRDSGYETVRMDTLRPADAPTPAAGKAASDPWVDTRIVSFDDTIKFGHGGFDFDAWESCRSEMHTRHGSFAVWKSGDRTWSMYGGNHGILALDRFSCEDHAKADAEQIVLSMDGEPTPAADDGRKAQWLLDAIERALAAPVDPRVYIADDVDVAAVTAWLGRINTPTADGGEVERLRAFLVWAGKQAVRTDCSAEVLIRGLKVMVDREAIASTAPSCPPGHVAINNLLLENIVSVLADADEYYASTDAPRGGGTARNMLSAVLHACRTIIAASKREG